jgi:hypothetical protein
LFGAVVIELIIALRSRFRDRFILALSTIERTLRLGS